jgi:hypothetical protein
MLRRSLIQILIGIVASISALWTVSALRANRCAGVGAQWLAATRTCQGPSGPVTVSRWTDIAAGLAVGVLLAAMLYRASTFAARRRSQLSS